MADIKMNFNTDVAGDIGTDSAIILSNIEFWQLTNKANKRNFFDGRYWTYNSIRAYKEIFDYLTEAQIRRCLDKLESSNYIISGCYNKSNYDRTKWYSSIRQIDLSELANGVDEINEPIPYNKPNTNTINNRETEFKNSLQPFLDVYGNDMLNDFYSYWTEKKPKGKKMLFEMQKTFDIKRRLERWKKNDYGKKNNNNFEINR